MLVTIILIQTQNRYITTENSLHAEHIDLSSVCMNKKKT